MRTFPSFDRIGPEQPETPVVVSVPHAGRDYPAAMHAMLRAPLARLVALEDRFVDAVARDALGREIALVQRRARAWIDLNRSEQERDPQLDDGADPTAQPGASVKLRSGLGLVPRRTPSVGDIWRCRLSAQEVDARIVADHRPYHHALAGVLAATRARFGIAILLDLHSMPALASGARVVLGDRFGRSAEARFVARVEAEAIGARVPVAINVPYAGGHILAAHGDPERGIHAIQVELDRALYLDRRLDRPGAGLDASAALVRRMLDALADEALGTADALAAE